MPAWRSSPAIVHNAYPIGSELEAVTTARNRPDGVTPRDLPLATVSREGRIALFFWRGGRLMPKLWGPPNSSDPPSQPNP